MERSGWLHKAAAGATLLVCIGLIGPMLSTTPVSAAGITTHAWMATTAVDEVTIPELRALLRANIGQVYAGAQFPDSGYVPGNTFGEEAHWQRFFDAYAQIIQTKPSCGELTAPTGPCAPEIAHLMGAMAHGMGDEVWDWLFEPESVDQDEYYLPAAFNGIAGPGGQELQMDLVAIALFGRVNPTAPPLPSKPDLLAAFEAAGFHGATAAQLDFGQVAQSVIHRVEANLAATHIAPLRAAMPYMSATLVTGPGGVEFAARAIAAEWENMWGRLLGNQPATRVGVTYPADGQRRVPATGWVRSYQPGSSPGRGGARTRIAATLTYSLPYVPPQGGPAVSSQLPSGSMVLREKATGRTLPVMSGYPRAVPYGPDAGEHMVDVQPAADLSSCTWYEVATTDKLLDARRLPVTPTTWSFRTGVGSAGGRCADDPYTDTERWIMTAQHDLRGVLLSPADLAAWIHRLDRDMDRVPATTELVASPDARRRLVDDTYRSYLGRPATADELTAGATRIATETLTPLRSDILGSAEYLTRSGRRNEGFARAVHLRVTGQPISDADLARWTQRLATGTSRTAMATALLRSNAGARQLVRQTVSTLLGRGATGAELDTWATRIAASDERPLITAIVSGAEYFARAVPRLPVVEPPPPPPRR